MRRTYTVVPSGRLGLVLALVLACGQASADRVADADDGALEKARSILERHPLIDGHNDLPWVIRDSGKPPRDVARLRPRHAFGGRHRHRAAARGRRRRPVLVRVRPERPRSCEARLRAHPARADRHRAQDDRALPARPRARAHSRRHRTRELGRPHRVAARHGRRARDREFARRAARLPRASACAT